MTERLSRRLKSKRPVSDGCHSTRAKGWKAHRVTVHTCFCHISDQLLACFDWGLGHIDFGFFRHPVFVQSRVERGRRSLRRDQEHSGRQQRKQEHQTHSMRSHFNRSNGACADFYPLRIQLRRFLIDRGRTSKRGRQQKSKRPGCLREVARASWNQLRIG